MHRGLFLALLFSILTFAAGYWLHDTRTTAVPLGFSVWSHEEDVSDGYVLMAPYYGASRYAGKGEVNLVDVDGTVMHSWKTQFPALVAYLQPRGRLFVALTPPLDINDYPSGGSTGILQELDKEGAVVWEYKDNAMTHDFEIVPDESIVYVRWHRASDDFAQRVRGGLETATTSVWTNELVRINRSGEIVWTWRPDDHVHPEDFKLNPLVARYDWAHINSVRYLEDNPLTHVPAYLVSARNISTVFLVDATTGAIIWMSPSGLLSLQHDASLTQRGTFLVFDNGLHRVQQKAYLASRVVEIDPLNDTIAWTFDGGASGLEKIQFASSIMSGAQRLSNGNTLITASTINTILEVSSSGRIVWKYTNDFRDADGTMRILFKTRKYPREVLEMLQ